MDFTTNHPHPHHHRSQSHLLLNHTTNGLSPSSSANQNQCPALRAPSERQNYQLPVPSPPQNSAHYDRAHNMTDENRWRLRPTQGSASPLSIFSRDRSHMGHSQDQTSATQSNQQALRCPAPGGDMLEVPDFAFPQTETYHPYIHSRPVMHPAPQLFTQPLQPFLGYENNMSRQPSSQHASDYHWLGSNVGFPLFNPARHASGSQGPTPAPYFAEATEQTNRLFPDENTRPGGQSSPHRATLDDNHSLSPSPEAAGPLEPADSAFQAGEAGRAGSPRSVSGSPSTPASGEPERTREQATHIFNPVYIRRIGMANTSRPRQSTSRTNTTADVGPDYEVYLRQGDLNLIEFAEAHPGVISNWEIQRIPLSVRKRVASKRALESLQSIDIATLPENERTCVICYNDFGVAGPEGINEAPLRLPKCKHVFGDHCIKKWFEESDTCPYCRDKVHSELQCTAASRRSYPAALRFMARFQASAQHAHHFRGAGQMRNQSHSQTQSQNRGQAQGQTQGQQSREHGTVDIEWTEHHLSDHDVDDSHGVSSDVAVENENRLMPGLRRQDSQSHSQSQSPAHSSRYASLIHGSLGRRSPPRRPRPRQRFNQAPPAGASIFGGPTSSGTSQTAVRPSRNSRSSSPSERTGTSGGFRSWRSLTDSTEQYRWNRSPSPASNRGGTASPSSGPLGDTSSLHFQSHAATPAEHFLQRLASSNPGAQGTNENNPGLQHPGLERFRLPAPGDAFPPLPAEDPGRVAFNRFSPYPGL